MLQKRMYPFPVQMFQYKWGAKLLLIFLNDNNGNYIHHVGVREYAITVSPNGYES